MAGSIKNVILIGAGGNLGPAILKGLMNEPDFKVSVLSRKSSKSTFPSEVTVHTISDDYPENELLKAFADQDAVVSTITTASSKQQESIIDAAVKAGVKRIIPSEFGSDTRNPKALAALPIAQGKVDVVEYLKAQESKGLTWSAVSTGPFFDWGITTGFLSYNLKEHKVDIYDDGNTKWSTTTLATIGLAVAGVLKKPAETANKYIYVASFTVSQNEVLAALEKATGKKWDVNHVSVEQKTKEGREAFARGELAGLFQLILANAYNDGVGGNFVTGEGLSNELLGLPTEDLDEVVANLVKG